MRNVFLLLALSLLFVGCDRYYVLEIAKTKDGKYRVSSENRSLGYSSIRYHDFLTEDGVNSFLELKKVHDVREDN